MAKTWLTIVEDKEKEFNDLYKRMDSDNDFRTGKAFKMKTLDGTQDMPGVTNVTSSEPSLHMNKTIARLAAVERQTEVLADKSMSDADTSFIENFIDDVDYEIDAFLNRKGEVPAADFHSDIGCSRGRMAEQIVTRAEDGVYISDVRPLDTRYLAYEIGVKDMLWGAVNTWRTRESIRDEYPEAQFGGRAGDSSLLKVTDVYYKCENKVNNIIYVAKNEIRHIDTPYKRVPFIVQVVPAGSVVKDKGNLKNTGESIYENLRDVFPEDNWILSTLKTLNYGLFKPPYQGTKIPDASPGDPGAFTEIERGEPIQPVFTPDIKRYTVLFNQRIRAAMEKAGYSTADFGQLDFPLSFLAIQRLAQGKLELLLPRLKAFKYLYQARYKMIIEQYLDINETLELGKEGHRREYPPDKLKGKYTISFRFFTVSKEEMAADAAVANAMGRTVSEDYKRREIHKLSNPDGEKMKLDIERVEATNPIVRLYNDCKSLIIQGRDFEAKAVKLSLLNLIRQQRTALPQGVAVKEESNDQALATLFGGGGGGGRVARPAGEGELDEG